MDVQQDNTQKTLQIVGLFANNSKDGLRHCSEPSDAEKAAFLAGPEFAAHCIQKAAHKSISPQG